MCTHNLLDPMEALYQWCMSSYNQNIVLINYALTWKIINWSGHNFAHVPTTMLSGHEQNCDQIGYVEMKWKQKRVFMILDYEVINDVRNKPHIPNQYYNIHYRTPGWPSQTKWYKLLKSHIIGNILYEHFRRFKSNTIYSIKSMKNNPLFDNLMLN